VNDRVFVRLPGDGYALTSADEGVRVELRHLRREHHQLHAEVDVQCEWAGARRIPGSLTVSCADLNLSSQHARTGRAEYCAKRTNVKPEDFDWIGLIDEACQRVISAERQGTEAIVLDDAPAEGPPRDFNVHGLSVPADSHSLLVCDGDGLKSISILLVLGEMAKRGIPVAYLDWEWTAGRHRQRKHRLFGADRLETLFYRRGRNSLEVEQDDIRRFCEERSIQFIGIDSIGAACEGKLADDDVARAYNRALDHLPPSLAAAHVPKNGDKDSEAVKPFGSAFFSNYTRMSWKLKKQVGASPDLVTVMYTPGKQNDGQRVRPVALEFDFAPDRIGVRNVEPATVDGFAQSLPLNVRLSHLLKAGPMTIAAIARELDAKPDSIQKALNRGDKVFTCFPGKDGVDRWALLERRSA
jgi:hypothetical protein